MTAAVKVQDQFGWWRNALAGNVGDIHDGEPQSGFYRMRRTGEQAKAVAYWRDTKNGSLRCQVDGTDVPEQRALELWPFAAKEPITNEFFKTKTETGQWPDMDDAAFSSLPSSREVIGGNNPPTDEGAAFKEQIESAKGGVGDYKKITSEEQKAKAQSLRSRLLELAGAVKKLHKKLKDPLWSQVKELDNRYLPLAKDAEAAAAQIRDAMDAFDTAELQKSLAAQKAAEEAAQKAEAAGKPAPEQPAPAPYVPQTTKGAYGRAASTKIAKVITEVTDWDALYGFLKSHKELRECMEKLAQRAVDANFDVPGVKIEERVKNR